MQKFSQSIETSRTKIFPCFTTESLNHSELASEILQLLLKNVRKLLKTFENVRKTDVADGMWLKLLKKKDQM